MKGFTYLLINKSVGLYINFLSYVNPNKALKLVYVFFSEPFKGRLSKNKLPEVLKETQTETFQYEGHQLQSYTWKGNENIVLLVHGWESNASRWENMLPYLKKSGSTIIAIDAPAHGLSSGKEFNLFIYAEFINIIAQKYKPKYVIGHSLGGQTCLYYQSVYQNDSLQKMVILGAPSDLKIIIDNFIDSFSLNSKISKEFKDNYIKNLKVELEHFTGELFASKINIQGLVAHDVYDDIVLIEEGKKIARSWKNSVFIETKGIGHSMHDDELYKKIFSFLFEDNSGK